MPDKSVELRLILSGIFLMSDFFDKCSVFLLRFSGLCQMVLMTSKTSLQKWSGVFCFRRFLLCFFKLVQLRINTACVSAGVDSCMNFYR